MNCNKHDCLSIVPIFRNVNEEEMKELARIVTHKIFHKGEPIFLAGEHKKNLFVVHTGKVKITHISEDGHEKVIRILQTGDFFGELSLFRNTNIMNNAEALEQTEICLLEGEQFIKIMSHTPNLLIKILQHLSERLEKAEYQLSQISNQDVGQRLASFILKQGECAKDEIFEFPMSKKDIASLLGTTRETLSRKLSSFQKEGYIALSGRRIQICDEKALRELL
ncbi:MULTISPECIES: Crp/Fnr family transcriptional regulator [Bacillus]|uniref:Crp/Fnr family transcriptional regulator n=1 Tax=Bacillus TaxID=1386 RepID=UPI0002F62310|nr:MULTISPECIES: Crp/Fnr family transcriptional regulator [Bacillus]